FLQIVQVAFQAGLKGIRISEGMDKGWFSLLLSPEYYVRDWIKEQEREYQRRIKSLISKTEVPHIPEEELGLTDRFALSDFYLANEPEIETPSLGAAYLLSQIAISFASHDRWLPSCIPLLHRELREEGEPESTVEAKNCATWESWQNYAQALERQKIASLQKGKALWEHRETEFPHLIFCGKAEKQLRNLTVSDTVFRQLWDALYKLNDFCETGRKFSLREIQEQTQLRMSDESETVRTNPSLAQLRTFLIEGEKVYFGYHIKNFSGALRLHFYPDQARNRIYIGYFGKHLPTAKH
ncbi:MAG: hypothetical protein AAF399_29930, partial [Bacteroidota bacterium]